MKIRLLFATLIWALAIVPGLHAQDDKPKPAAGEKEDTTELGEKMDKMNTAFRKLRRQIADSTKNEDSLAAVAVLRAGAEDALKLEPEKKADIPAADQAKFVSDYQDSMKATIAEIGKLEDALKAGKNEDAAKIFAKIGDMQKEAHKKFRRPPAKKS